MEVFCDRCARIERMKELLPYQPRVDEDDLNDPGVLALQCKIDGSHPTSIR